ncbi:hypothetical protein HanPI659440_Chr02g0034741 [Helianthus annuus]|nr:hypothetical protein HanPI659440_Chr02g0034741 [Helianthus annuus]
MEVVSVERGGCCLPETPLAVDTGDEIEREGVRASVVCLCMCVKRRRLHPLVCVCLGFQKKKYTHRR